MTDSTKKSLCCCTIMAIAAILFIGSGFSWSWAGAVLVLAVIGGLAYAYYRKIKLPRHRANREASQQQATQQQRQQEFLLELMNRPAPH